MANDTQTATTLLKYQVDTGTVTTALNANAKIIESNDTLVGSVRSGAEQLAAMGASINDVTISGDTLVSKFNEVAASQVKVADAYDQVAASASKAADAQEEAASSGRGVSPQQIAGRVAGLGSIVGSAGGAGFRDAAQIIQLGAAFGIAGVGVGIAALAFKGVTDRAAETTKELVDSAAAYGKVEETARSATTEQLRGQLDKAKGDVAFAQAFFEQQQANLNNYIKNNPGIDITGLGAAAELIEGRGGTLGGLKQAADDAKTSLGAAQDNLNALNIVLLGTSTAANDATASAKLLNDAQLDFVKNNIELQGKTTDQLKAQAAELAFNIDRINRALLSGELSDTTGEIDAYSQSLLAQYKQIEGLIGQGTTYQDTLNAELAAKEALTKQNGTYFDALEQEGKIRDQITADTDALTKLRTDASTKEIETNATRDDAIAKAEVDAGEKRTEIVQNSLDAIAKIERDAGRAEGEAVGNRDANALRLATIKEKDALDDQKKADAKQIAQLGSTLAKQEATINTSYDKQVRQIESALSQQTQIQQRKLLQDQTDLINITNAELAISHNASIGVQNTVEYMWQGIESTFATYAFRIQAGLNAAFSGGGGLPAVTGTAAMQNIALDTTRKYINGLVQQAGV